MAMKNKPKLRDPEVVDLMDKFTWMYRESLTHLRRMQEMLNVYDNIIDDASWPTESKISVPWTFTTVENALPSAIEYLFPNSPAFRLNPIQIGMNMDNIRNTELALHHTLRYRMQLQKHAVPTIKDCFRFGIGYGIIEPYKFVVPELYTKEVISGGETISRARMLQPGVPKVSVRYRYLSPGQVLTSMDGCAFNGINKVSISCFIDSYSESAFRTMYAEQASDSEDVILKGNVEDIIAESKSTGFDARVAIEDIIAKLAGIKINKIQHDKAATLRIPVLKFYMDNRHVWIANGTTIIYDHKNILQTMRCPLTRASAWPDGLRWYPMSPIEAAYKVSQGNNVFISAIYDLLTNYLRPTMLYNKQAFSNKAPERGPRGEIATTGNINDSAKYLDTPQVPEQLFTLGDMMQRAYAQSVGDKSFLNQSQAGLMRGGPFAFESLLQSMGGRERLAGAILETDWLTDVIAQTLIQMQINIGPEGDMFAVRDFDPMTNEEVVRSLEITENDLINAYDVEIDLSDKAARSAMSEMQKQNEAQWLIQSGYAEDYEVMYDTLGSGTRARRLLKSKEQVTKMQEEKRQAEMAAMRMQQTPAGETAPAAPELEQALAGAGAAALGGGGIEGGAE